MTTHLITGLSVSQSIVWIRRLDSQFFFMILLPSYIVGWIGFHVGMKTKKT